MLNVECWMVNRYLEFEAEKMLNNEWGIMNDEQRILNNEQRVVNNGEG